MEEKIGVFGGSFDPVHFGHINLAIQLYEKKLVDKIFFIPAWCSPFKVNTPPKADANHRINMLKLALEGLDYFLIDDMEIKKNGVSYSIDTIKILKEKFTSLFFISAQDTACEIYKWKNYRLLIEMATLIVGKTSEKLSFPDNGDENLEKIIIKNLIPINNMDISSTDIRERLKNSLYCSHLLPAKVLDYIYQYKLYL